MDPRRMADAVYDYVVEQRRDLHRHPELAWQETRTTGVIAAELKALGIPFRRFEPTGLIATIAGGAPGRTVLLRADIDALAVQEESGVCFASEVPGVAHTCGHDTHAAMLLGAARALWGARAQLAGTVKLLFQPAEEGMGGAKALVEQGALDGVDVAFALHIFACQPAGTLLVGQGACAASSDRFHIYITGQAAHGAAPHTGADAALAAAATVVNLQGIVARELPPAEAAVVTVGILQAGTAYNVLPGSAYIEGTTRTFSREIRARLPGMLERIAGHTAQAHRCTAKVEYEHNIDVLVCNDAASELAFSAARRATGAEVGAMPPMTMAEDFAEYAARVPACLVALGGGGEHPQHSGRFAIEEAAMRTGTAFHIAAALEAL